LPGDKGQPIGVHTDINSAEAARNACDYLPAEEKDYKYSRALHLNNWRTFSPPPQDRPLAVCDANTVGDDEGVLSIGIWQKVPPPPDFDNLPQVPPVDGTIVQRVGEAAFFLLVRNRIGTTSAT